MFVNDSSTGFVKLGFLSLLLIGALTFCGGLAMADTGLFNWQMQGAEAEALRVQSQIAAERDIRQLPYIEEQWRIQTETLRLEADLNRNAMLAEAERAHNFRSNLNMIGLGVIGFAGFALVALITYAALRFIGQAFDNHTPTTQPPGRNDTTSSEHLTTPRSESTRTNRRSTAQPAYLRRNTPLRETTVVIQEGPAYQHHNGQSENGRSRQ